VSGSRISRARFGGLFELVGDLVEPGFDAGLVLVAARRARDADRATIGGGFETAGL
jgi:hypothetical protein